MPTCGHRHTILLALMVSAACEPGSIMEPADPPVVATPVEELRVPGGWGYMHLANRSGRALRTDLCDAWLEYDAAPDAPSWRQWFDPRSMGCSTDSLTLADGDVEMVRYPLPDLHGRYRLRLDWRDADGAVVAMISTPFDVDSAGPMVMVLMSPSVTASDGVGILFINRSSRPWRVDICDKLRFERMDGGGRGWFDVGPRPDACDLPAFDVPAGGRSASVLVPVWSTLYGGRLRIRQGFTGPVGEVEVVTSGAFDAYLSPPP